MTNTHILNTPLPPSSPRPVSKPLPSPEQKKIDDHLRRTKASEAVARAISTPGHRR